MDASAEPVCAACHTRVSVGARFCPHCGHPVAVADRSRSRLGAPESYMPKYLASKILILRTSLEGERKQVTVLFADMKGSLELLADRDPEEARELLDPVLERMIEAVHRYEGTVNQVMGDGIMALFGAPLAHEDHAVRACYAAVRMQQEIARYGEEIQRSGDPPVQIRVGLNSGDVVVRTIGSDLQMDYTAVGQTTHLAGRMEQIARPGSILLTRETLRLAEGYVHVKSLGEVPVRGLGVPVETYELTGVGAAQTRLQAAVSRGLTRFVGRRAELDYLDEALEQTRGRRGRVVAAVGEAGVGKSRLFWEVTHSHRTQGWRVIESASISHGKASPYAPVIEMLKAYFQIELGDEPRRIREKVTGMAMSLDRVLEPFVPALLSLLDVEVDDPSWQQMEPPQRRQRTLEAIESLLLRESEVQPVLLVYEDLNWIDDETQTLLDRLVAGLSGARILLLVSFRPEYEVRWEKHAHYSQIRVRPLPPATAEELLRTLLGPDTDLEPLKQLLIARTEGNPLFLEESVRTLVESGVLKGSRGSYHLTRNVDAVQVPATVQAILATRIDRLPPVEKQLLQAAAVIGKHIPSDLLRFIASMPEDDFRRALAGLQSAEFMYESRLFPDPEYTFKHALTHEVASASLLQERRVKIHAEIVQAVETLYRDRLGEHIERLAHHSVAGRMWSHAFGYLKQAGAKALSRAANREAVTCFKTALEVLEKLPDTDQRIEQAIDLRFDLRSALLPLAEFSHILKYLREAEALAKGLGDARRAALLSVYMTGHSYLLGDYEQAVTFGDRALKTAAALDDFTLTVAASAYQGQVHYVRGEFRRAVSLFRRNVEVLVGDRERERCGLPQLPAVHSRACLGWCLAELGEFEEALTATREAMRIAEAIDHPLNMIVACSGLGSVQLALGNGSAALPLFERGLELVRRWNVPLWFPRLATGLGASYILVGRAAEALRVLEEGEKKAEAMRLAVGHSQLLRCLSEAHLQKSEQAMAIAMGSRALTLARSRQERGSEAWALLTLGDLASRLDPLDPIAVRGNYEEAIDLASALGMRPIVGRATLGLSYLERRLGLDSGPARFNSATALLRELGMARWAEGGKEGLSRSG